MPWAWRSRFKSWAARNFRQNALPFGVASLFLGVYRASEWSQCFSKWKRPKVLSEVLQSEELMVLILSNFHYILQQLQHVFCSTHSKLLSIQTWSKCIFTQLIQKCSFPEKYPPISQHPPPPLQLFPPLFGEAGVHLNAFGSVKLPSFEQCTHISCKFGLCNDL